MSTSEKPGPRATWIAVLIVWAITAVAAVTVAAVSLAGGGWFAAGREIGVFGAFGVVLGISVLAALFVQLALQRPEGYLARVSASFGGSTAIVLVCAAVALPAALAANG